MTNGMRGTSNIANFRCVSRTSSGSVPAYYFSPHWLTSNSSECCPLVLPRASFFVGGDDFLSPDKMGRRGSEKPGGEVESRLPDWLNSDEQESPI